MDDNELNAKLGALSSGENDELSPEVLKGSGKVVAYYGWFWRHVEFSEGVVTFAYCNGGGFDEPSWVGFCQNNKWDYEEFVVSGEPVKELRALLVELVEKPSKEKATEVFDFMQKLRPAEVKGTRRYGDG